MAKQIMNPYLPSFEYIPDGEPHVFGDRLYVYGSHDRFGGAEFCLNDYVCYSAPLDDLTDWRYEGVIYRKLQDPRNQNIPADTPPTPPGFAAPETYAPEALNAPGVHAMFAPDVVKGPDGRYYLFYCLDCLPQTAVAVCDTPAGEYRFHGFVRHADGTALGERPGDPHQFDPGVFVDDDGQVYHYSGNAPMANTDWMSERNFSQVMKLENDMLTLKEEPRKLLPDLRDSDRCGFDGHEFFEASSIRKIHGRYYFIYSSIRSHELCYAVSDKPDIGYRFGGTLVDIGDVFLNGRTADESVNALGNTHGSIECVNGQWYVFYHRQTNRTQYSRQACAEKIYFNADGSIPQVEVTSQGMNDGALAGKGVYGARIACHLTRHGKNVESLPVFMKREYPYFTQDGGDLDPTPDRIAQDKKEPLQYIANIQDGVRIGFKYFHFEQSVLQSIRIRGRAKGVLMVENAREIALDLDSADWTEIPASIALPDGVHALYVNFKGEGVFEWKTFELA